MNRSYRWVAVVAIPALMGCISTALAETWVGPSPADGSLGGSWNSSANWNPATIPNAIGASATFLSSGQTVTRTINLDSAVKLGSLNVNNDVNITIANQLQNGTGGSLEFDASSGNATINVTGSGTSQYRLNATMLFTDSVTVNVLNPTLSTTGAFSLLGIISGSGGLTKDGPGMMTFAFVPSTTNTFKDYTGPTVINAGRFRVSPSSGSAPRMTSSVTVNPGGQITYTGAGTLTFGSSLATIPDLNLNGNGLAAFPGAIRADQGTSSLTNPVVLQSDTSINLVSTSVAGNSNVASLTLTNTVSGPGILRVGSRPGLFDRRGTLILSAANTYTAGTIIEQGAINVTGSGSLGTGTVLVDGATLNAPDNAFDTFGSLILQNNTAIADSAYLNITGGGAANSPDRGFVDLASGVNEVVGGLMLGGVIYGPGTYGSSTSSASPTNPGLSNPDEFFAGDGIITVVPAGVPGDYNGNNVVDAADYVLWRSGGPLQNDFTPGVQAADFDFWRSRFGATTNPGSGSGLEASGGVPEPATIALFGLGVTLVGFSRRRLVALSA